MWRNGYPTFFFSSSDKMIDTCFVYLYLILSYLYLIPPNITPFWLFLPANLCSEIVWHVAGLLKEYSNNFSMIVLASLISIPVIFFFILFRALCLLQTATRWRTLIYRNWLLPALRHIKSFGHRKKTGFWHGWESKSLRNIGKWDFSYSVGPFKFSIVLRRSGQRANTPKFPPMQMVWHSSWISQQEERKMGIGCYRYTFPVPGQHCNIRF